MDIALNKKRHMGIELLRIISMLMIVILHVLGQGGILAGAAPFSIKYQIAWFLEIAAFCAVNCYALISGYVGINARFRYSRIVKLWLQIFSYTIVITAFFSIKYPDLVGANVWYRAFFPIMTQQYWYLTAYFGMFFFIPLMNAAVNSLPRKELRMFLYSIITIFTVVPSILQVDPFKMAKGYSMIWLCILYIFGAYIRKYQIFERVRKWVCGLVYILAIVFTWGSKYILMKYPISFLSDGSGSGKMFIAYTSPTILVAGIALLLLFSEIDFKNKIIMRGISIFASASLGVYIIHVNPLIWENYMKGISKSYIQNSCIEMVAKIFVLSIGIYCFCVIIDIVRSYVFKILHIS